MSAAHVIPWIEVGRKDLECRIPCPKCGKPNFIRGTDTPYFFECELKDGKRVIQCENRQCLCFIPIKKSKLGVEVIV